MKQLRKKNTETVDRKRVIKKDTEAEYMKKLRK
jgi:hypothetical protein